MSDFSPDGTAYDPARSFRRHGWTGLGLTLLFIGGLAVWAASTPVSGAVAANGVIDVEGNSKSVQHDTGGILGEINVQNGDVVEAGQVLAVLSDSSIDSQHQALTRKRDDALIKRARIEAELAAVANVELPSGLADPENKAAVAALQTQQEIAQTNRAAVVSTIAQIEEQVGQLEAQISGVESQREAITRQIELLNAQQQFTSSTTGDEPSETSTSPAQAPTVMSSGSEKSNELVRLRADAEYANFEGQLATISTEVARLQGSMAEKRHQIDQIQRQDEVRALDELQATQTLLSELDEEISTNRSTLEEMKILSPVDGIVHESIIDTVGGVVTGGETLMRVVPQTAALKVELKVGPTDIDKVHAGGEVMLRLSSFDPRTTPELSATIGTISPDATTDPTSGSQFYLVEADVAESELQNLPDDVNMQPGMPVDTFISTRERTVLSYLISPLSEQLNRAFRED